MAKAPTELLQAYRRDQILEAAHTVISQRGYDRSSVDQIAKSAGLSRSTVYEYFSSKEEILKGCFAARHGSLADELARGIEGSNGIEAQLSAFFEICLSRVDENREFFLAIAFPMPLDEATASAGPGGAELALLVKVFNDAVTQILDSGFERGELATPVSPAIRECLGTLVVGAMAARSRRETPRPKHEAAADIVRFALGGLRG